MLHSYFKTTNTFLSKYCDPNNKWLHKGNSWRSPRHKPPPPPPPQKLKTMIFLINSTTLLLFTLWIWNSNDTTMANWSLHHLCPCLGCYKSTTSFVAHYHYCCMLATSFILCNEFCNNGHVDCLHLSHRALIDSMWVLSMTWLQLNTLHKCTNKQNVGALVVREFLVQMGSPLREGHMKVCTYGCFWTRKNHECKNLHAHKWLSFYENARTFENKRIPFGITP